MKDSKTDLIADHFFKHSLMKLLVDRGAITCAEARTVMVDTAAFCHEIADDEKDPAYAIGIARGYELMAESFPGRPLHPKAAQ